MHLLHEVVVGKLGKDDLVVFGHVILRGQKPAPSRRRLSPYNAMRADVTTVCDRSALGGDVGPDAAECRSATRTRGRSGGRSSYVLESRP